MKAYKDICVVGTELPGLIAGRILQRKGARVHFIEHYDYTQFDPVICEFLSGIFVKPLMQRLGFHPTEIQQLVPLDVPAQFICKNKRINFFKDSQKLKKEFERENVDATIYSLLHRDLEKDYKIFHQIYHREVQVYEKKSIFQKDLESQLKQKTSMQMLKMLPMHQMMTYYGLRNEYTHFIKSLELVFSYCLADSSNHSRFTHLAHLLQDDGYYSVLGVRGLKQKLMQYLKEKGATFETFSKIAKVYHPGNKISRFKLVGAPTEDVEFGKLIVNGNPLGFTAYEPEDKKIQALTAMPKMKTIGKRLYFVFKIHKSYLPYGIRTQGVIFPKTIETSADEKRKIPRVLRYVLYVPNQQAVNYKTYLSQLEKDYALLATTYFVMNEVDLAREKIHDEIFKTMQQLIPFFTPEKVELVHGYMPSMSPPAGDMRQGFIYQHVQDEKFGLAGNPIETDFKNVWVANESNFPSIGLDGQILTGDQLAQFMS
ncbi:MAG: hypothetical protein R3A45_10575 [Bdellovibrionota bacterium]|nr:hypothetical protein [Deltaproteobacteria bacterium]